MTELPENYTVFVFDLNGLKTVNDTIGHDAGDALIVVGADCIASVFDNAGKCFRTGGDEFVVITNMKREEAEGVLRRLEEKTKHWSSDKYSFSLSIAAGFARAEDYSGLTAEELTKKADQAMYASKAAYYQSQRQNS